MNHEKSPAVSTYWKKYAIFSFTLIEVIGWAFEDCITCICIVCKDVIAVEYTVHVIKLKNVITINVFVSDLLVYPAACTRTSNTPIQSFTDFIRRVKNWSGRYFWNYVVQGETDDDNPSSLSRDLGDAEEEMEKFHSSTNTRLASVSNYNIHKYC